jgi:hypothetical protein
MLLSTARAVHGYPSAINDSSICRLATMGALVHAPIHVHYACTNKFTGHSQPRGSESICLTFSCIPAFDRRANRCRELCPRIARAFGQALLIRSMENARNEIALDILRGCSQNLGIINQH